MAGVITVLVNTSVEQILSQPRQPPETARAGVNKSTSLKVSGRARSDLAEIQGITIWPLLVPWPAATVLYLSVAFF